ncbi:type II secretion system F family protein [Neisseriaceae bacterium JH1-16]|nr:type II secretion system F family protein [Neisseriaceae bacterium JH1-16]
MFVRQLATMLKAGVPLLQALDIATQGHAAPALARLLSEVKDDLEAGSSLAEAFRRHPRHFDRLFCSLVAAGEAGGVLDTLLDRLATYREKMLMLKSKLRSVLVYPATIVVASCLITAMVMLYVVPAFKALFAGFGAELPLPTQLLIRLSDLLLAWHWPMLASLLAAVGGLGYAFRRSPHFIERFDGCLLRLPVLGAIVRRGVIARWSRTLAILFAAGVPIVDALDSVGGAAGNRVFQASTRRIRAEVNSGVSLNRAMQRSALFPPVVLQMTAIGEEAGALDTMLLRVADLYEDEVDNALASLSSLLEPAIMLVLGVLIGGLVLAMYWPIFEMGQVVG